MQSAVNINGSRILAGGTRVLLPAYKSFHRVAGLSSAWRAAGVIDGHFVNLNPDDFPQGDNAGPGGRAGLYQDIGTNNYTITYTQEFNAVAGAYVQSAPLVCIDLDDPRFGLALWYESQLYGGAWVVWEIGRLPEDIVVHTNADTGIACAELDIGLIPDDVYTQLEIKMVVANGRIQAYGNGVLQFDFPIPAGLLGSTLVGMSIDIGFDPARPRPPNIPTGLAPYSLVTASQSA
jgi:hypothetical protein